MGASWTLTCSQCDVDARSSSASRTLVLALYCEPSFSLTGSESKLQVVSPKGCSTTFTSTSTSDADAKVDIDVVYQS